MAKRTKHKTLPKGVYLVRATGKYTAKYQGKHLGTFSTPEEAAQLREAVASLDSGRRFYTLRDWGIEWLDEREACGEYRRVRDNRNTWSRYIDTWDCVDWPIGKIQPRDVRALVSSLEKTDAVCTKILRKQNNKKVTRSLGRKLSRARVLSILCLLRKSLNDAVDAGKLETNPARDVRVGKKRTVSSSREPIEYFRAEEIRELLSCPVIPERQRTIFTVAVYTGLRPGELWGLHWEDVILKPERPEVIVRFSYDQPPKNGRTRRVPLLPPVREALSSWRSRGGTTRVRGLVWTFRDRGETMHTPGYDAQWERWRCKTSIRKLPFYHLRHTCGSHLVMGTWHGGEGMRLEKVAKWLGHATPEITARHYAHLAPELLHESRLRMERAWTE